MWRVFEKCGDLVCSMYRKPRIHFFIVIASAVIAPRGNLVYKGLGILVVIKQKFAEL